MYNLVPIFVKNVNLVPIFVKSVNFIIMSMVDELTISSRKTKFNRKLDQSKIVIGHTWSTYDFLQSE